MSFFSKLFSFKSLKVEQKEQPRYIVLENQDSEDEWMPKSKGNASYKILDTKENMKLGLHIHHEVYDAGAISHEDYPDGNKNGVDVSLEVVVGNFHKYPFDDSTLAFRRSAKVLDKDLKRLATNDDADFALYTKLQKELREENSEQAILMHNLLKAVKSDILSSPNRITEEYRQQKLKEEAEKIAKEEALRAEREIMYRQEQLKITEQQKKRNSAKTRKISAYMQNMQKIKADVLEK